MILVLKNVLFTILVPGTVAGLLPYWLFGPYRAVADAATLVAGICLVFAGLALYVACIWPFASIGKGTPAPIDAPVRLIVVGPYRFVRNPMYVAVLSVIFGQSIVTGSAGMAIYGVVVAGFFHLFVVGYEEPTLARRFQDDYLDYRRRVPRWMPRLAGLQSEG